MLSIGTTTQTATALPGPRERIVRESARPEGPSERDRSRISEAAERVPRDTLAAAEPPLDAGVKVFQELVRQRSSDAVLDLFDAAEEPIPPDPPPVGRALQSYLSATQSLQNELPRGTLLDVLA